MRGERSLKTEIRFLVYGEFPRWVHGGRIQRLAFELGFLPENAARRARELSGEGIFEQRYNEKHQVEFRYSEELMPKVIREPVQLSLND